MLQLHQILNFSYYFFHILPWYALKRTSNQLYLHYYSAITFSLRVSWTFGVSKSIWRRALYHWELHWLPNQSCTRQQLLLQFFVSLARFLFKLVLIWSTSHNFGKHSQRTERRHLWFSQRHQLIISAAFSSLALQYLSKFSATFWHSILATLASHHLIEF